MWVAVADCCLLPKILKLSPTLLGTRYSLPRRLPPVIVVVGLSAHTGHGVSTDPVGSIGLAYC